MKPNILWITLESARSDHTSMGGDRNTTPFLEQLVSDYRGAWFENCFAHGRWTPAASGSILTGTRLSTHRVGLESSATVEKLPTELSTIPELLGDVGYRTGGFSGNPYVSERTELNRGFETFFGPVDKSDFLSRTGIATAASYLRRVRSRGSALDTNPGRHKPCLPPLYHCESFKNWIDTDVGEDPFFAYFHLNNVHHPYTPPLSLLEAELDGDVLSPVEAIELAAEITDNRWQVMADGCNLSPMHRRALEATYRAELTYADRIVEEVFRHAHRQNRELCVVITGDHGELFGEGGVIGHNLVLHDKLLNVPLVTYGLETGSAATTDLVQHADVATALLNSVGAETSQFQAIDFTEQRREYVVAERGARPTDLEKLRDRNPEFDTEQFHTEQMAMIRSHEWKYQRSVHREELFELPNERENRITDEPQRAATLRRALEDHLASKTMAIKRRERMTADEGTTRRLEHLGYL
ncbi:sulfatase-like hydrolase/transferase [Natrononativus amylolyticus]|uniref:sulfatase-like hydrolase/transferase n=1 Tax=Natrononativus amylolyticus TaxID=2963434 RepID=UPI0020CB81CB|nr:sulfatase-like hydrolase/transferase [Natrononativus amylolyticus]